VLFRITDAFEYGDTFNVFVDGAMIPFQTPAVPIVPGAVTNPDLAWLDPGYSKGAILLAPGAHTINVFVRDSPYGGGGAYLRADVIPEPTTWALFGGAFALLVVGRIRKRILQK
jgi:hypothetical protein